MKGNKLITITSLTANNLQQNTHQEKLCSSRKFLLGESVNGYMEKLETEDVFQNFTTIEDVIASAELEFDAIELPETNPYAQLGFNKVRRPSGNNATVWRNHWLFSNGSFIYFNYRIEISRHSPNKDCGVEEWANSISAESIHIALDKIASTTDEFRELNRKLDKIGLHSFQNNKNVTGLKDFLEWHNATGLGRSLLLEEEVS
jgi:hypothetical protein